MTIIVEDGTIVAGANSYLSLADLKLGLPDYTTAELIALYDDAELTTMLMRSMEYLDSFHWKGLRVNPFHTVAWPRTDVLYAPYTLYPEDQVPVEVKKALTALVAGVIEEGYGAIAPPQNIRREKVNQLEVEYYSNGGVGTESELQQSARRLVSVFTTYLGAKRV